MNVLVCFYVKNEILAEYLLLQEVEHLQKFFELIDIFNLLSLILQAAFLINTIAQNNRYVLGNFRKYWESCSNSKSKFLKSSSYETQVRNLNRNF